MQSVSVGLNDPKMRRNMVGSELRVPVIFTYLFFIQNVMARLIAGCSDNPVNIGAYCID